MKLVMALDSFKGSISSADAARAIEKGFRKIMDRDDLTIIVKPIADGGEGTLDAIVPPSGRISAEVSGPLFERINAEYGQLDGVAVIEMASAAGLTLLDEKDRNAGITTTYGVGELICDALNKGFNKIMLTVGGSATNDGGCGMLAALGAAFKDVDGNTFIPTGDTLSQIADIDISCVTDKLFNCDITIATDVKNPLLGESGATYVYGRQKGLSDSQLESVEAGMRNYAEIISRISGKELFSVAGAGAGGGIAVPLLAFTDAKISSGIDTVLDVVDFDKAIADADAVVTGEGRIDVQSLYGKAISGVVKRAVKRGIPVYCFVGCVGDDADAIKRMGISEIYSISELAESAEDSMKNAALYLEARGKELAIDFMYKFEYPKEGI